MIQTTWREGHVSIIIMLSILGNALFVLSLYLSSSVAHPQSQRPGVRLPHALDRWCGFLPAPSALHPVALPAGAAGLHRLDPRHGPTDWSEAQNTNPSTCLISRFIKP